MRRAPAYPLAFLLSIGLGCGQTHEPSAAVTFKGVSISSDGRSLAWVEGQGNGKVMVLPEWRKNGTHAVQVTGAANAPLTGSQPAWSPDSSSIAFLSDNGNSGQDQLWVAHPDGRQAHKLTGLTGYVARPRWSPDGQSIAFLYVEGGAGGGPLGALPPQTGVIEGEVHNQRIAVADAMTGKMRMASPADLHVFDFDWSPDGQRFAGVASPGPGDNNWWVARLYTFDAQSGAARVIYEPRWQIAIPRWSPDGKRVAFIEGLMSDEGFHGGDLVSVASGGEEVRNHTTGRKSSPNWLAWLSPSKVLFSEYVGGGGAISTLDLESGAIESRWSGIEGVNGGGHTANLSVSGDGSETVVVRQSFAAPPEVWAGAVGAWKPVTRANAALQPAWGACENVQWKSDGFDVQGWLLAPANVTAGKRYPMVVVVHGGPASILTQSWPKDQDNYAMLASKGYYVFFPNPRGSYGQGENFTRANRKDFGGGDLRDILAGVDALLARYPVAPSRIGMTGWSYGGYMTMWAVTQTGRFKAAVAGAGIANWQSYYGENAIDQWMIPYFGATVYADPAVYAKSSPVQFIKQVRTPTLVVVGERDAECPAPQSFEFWHALKTLGVPTQLVVYAGEGHGFTDPAHRKDLFERMLAWFDKYMPE